MHIHVTDPDIHVTDPEEIRAIKARYFEAGTEFHLVPVLEFPEEGIEEMFLDNLCVDILKSGNRVIICSMEFAERLERNKKRMDEIGGHLSEAFRAEAGRKLRAECSKIGFDYDDAVLIEKNRVREGVH